MFTDDDEEFYDPSCPPYPQQGDIFPAVPLLTLPASNELVLLRNIDNRAYLPALQPGPCLAVRERVINDAFEPGPEYVVVSGQRGMGVVLTQTCDLIQSEYWLVSPAREVEGTEVDRQNLFAGKYATLFGLPPHPKGYFQESYVDLSDLHRVHKQSVPLGDRVGCLTRSVQNSLSEKLARSMSRRWGYEPDEPVPITGWYKCNRCNDYYVENQPQKFVEGESFPRCPNCDKIHKTASWYPLLKHKKS